MLIHDPSDLLDCYDGTGRLRDTISLTVSDPMRTDKICFCALFCCFDCALFYVARFGPAVARASLVVARRVRRTDEGGNQGIRLCGRIVNIDFSVTFDVSIWFLARSGKSELMKAGNVMLVFDDGG